MPASSYRTPALFFRILEPRQRLATDAHHRSQMAGDDEDASQKSVESVTIEDPYSHSIINEPSEVVDLLCARPCLADFYRHFYRQPVRHQHWRGFPGDSTKSDLSRSIDIYRLLRRLPTPWMRCSCGPEKCRKTVGIKRLKLLSRLTFSPLFLPS